jgi:hypothetical protein
MMSTPPHASESGERPTLANMMATTRHIVRVRLVGSKFSHYVLKDALRTLEDKTQMRALCHTQPGHGEAWRFNRDAGRICNACHAAASSGHMVIAAPPVLSNYRASLTIGAARETQSEIMEAAVLLVSKYGGRCQACQDAYHEGESIWWRRGWGCTHKACGKETLYPKEGA